MKDLVNIYHLESNIFIGKEFVDRLRLLCASKQVGNNYHDNEIAAILEELREVGVIYEKNESVTVHRPR